MTWQEPIVAFIVGYAVVALYKHLRALVGSAAPDAKASCHGCDDCGTDTAAPRHSPVTAPLPPGDVRVH